MFSGDNAKIVEAWEFVVNTSAEGEPAADESVAMLFDTAIWRNNKEIR